MRNVYTPLFVLITGTCMIFDSCSTCSRQQHISGDDVNNLSGADSVYVNVARNVFYSLPTPIEMSILVKNLGVEYRSTLLNDPLNASTYATSNKMALNFGIYVTDLVYAGLFNQTQTMLRYKLAIQQMIDGLGMSVAVDNNVLKSLEENINDKETMLRILAETYSSCSVYLKENGRDFLSISVLVGGWIEGMYIASSQTNENLVSSEKQIERLVIDQKLTFDMLWQVMSDSINRDIPEINELMTEMMGLVEAFDAVEISTDTSQNKVVFDEKEQTDVIESLALSSVRKETFENIKEQIRTIRHNFVK